MWQTYQRITEKCHDMWCLCCHALGCWAVAGQDDWATEISRVQHNLVVSRAKCEKEKGPWCILFRFPHMTELLVSALLGCVCIRRVGRWWVLECFLVYPLTHNTKQLMWVQTCIVQGAFLYSTHLLAVALWLVLRKLPGKEHFNMYHCSAISSFAFMA